MKINGTFKNNERIPEKYTCDGLNVNPSLEISGVPKASVSLALVMDDPDSPSGNWAHWIVFNIPVKDKIEENSVPAGATQGKNGWGENKYGGPCPGKGEHRYFFKLYALDVKLDLKQGTTKEEIEKAMQGHILAKAELIGKYSRNN